MTTKISVLAIDLAKGSFQVCAIGADRAVLYDRVLSRTRLAALPVEQPSCVVAMEACATSHHWGLVAQQHGLEAGHALRPRPLSELHAVSRRRPRRHRQQSSRARP